VTTSAPEKAPHRDRSARTNAFVRPLFLFCAVLGVLLLGGLVAVTAMGALGAFSRAPRIANGPPVPLRALVETTFLTSAVALVLAVPVGLLAALYLTEFASIRVRVWLEVPLRFLALVPPIVYGYFAASTLLPKLGALVPGLDERPALGAGIALAGMIVPCFLEHGRAAMATVSRPLRDAACALGASKFTTAMFVVVPAARRRLLAALMLAASRAVGETMIVLVVFTACASKQPSPPATLTTFFVPNRFTTLAWENQVPQEFFVVGCALLLLAFSLDAARISLDKPVRGDVR